MTAKKTPEIPVTPEAESLSEVVPPTTEVELTDSISALILGDRRTKLIDTFVASILAGQKLDLEGKMPDQQQRDKIFRFASKLADDVIAATNS